MKLRIVLLLLFAFNLITANNVSAAEHRFGIGANYWSSIDDIKENDGDIDDDGFSFIGMYQYWPSLLGFGLEAEFLPDRFGETAIAPAAYVFVGKAIYAGAGIGITYSDSDFADQPFFALRAGLDLEIIPRIHVNIYGNYRFNDKAEFNDDDTDIDTDTIFLGAAVLFGF
jgi:hypothetical protein